MENLLKEPRRAFALTDADKASLTMSASGGAFAVFARAVLEQGGVVFGAESLDDGTVCHVGITTLKELPKLQGSKYVWSDLGTSIDRCIKALSEGRNVLFSGVPCQIAVLNAKIQKANLSESQKERLITCDLICHGTPSADLYKAYIKWLSERLNADDGVHGYRFRTKYFGWGLYYYYYYYYRNSKKVEVWGGAGDDPYYFAFSKGGIYRACCYSCKFAQRMRPGDFTIGDFWGVKERIPGAYDSDGVSAVLANTEKAEKFLEQLALSSDCRIAETTFEAVSDRQTNLSAPTSRTEEDERLAAKIDDALASGEISKIFEEYLSIDMGWKARLRRILPPRFLRIIYARRNAG